MGCEEIKELLVEYYYNELNKADSESVDRHLRDCKDCSREWKELKMTLDAVEVEEVSMPQAFWIRYLGKVYEKIERRSSWNWISLPRLAPALTGSVLVVLLFFGGLLYLKSDKEDNIFIARNYEFIQELELFQDYDIIQYLEELEAMDQDSDRI